MIDWFCFLLGMATGWITLAIITALVSAWLETVEDAQDD